jgi:hypothetical protein
VLQTGPFQAVTETSNRENRNPLPSPDGLMTHILSLFVTSFTIGTLYSPLIAYTYYLWRQYTGSTNLATLQWYELFLLLTLILLPLGAMKLLKISWTTRDIPG